MYVGADKTRFEKKSTRGVCLLCGEVVDSGLRNSVGPPPIVSVPGDPPPQFAHTLETPPPIPICVVPEPIVPSIGG